MNVSMLVGEPGETRVSFEVIKSLSCAREWRNWQTRWLQVPVLARAWGFKSPLAHTIYRAGLFGGPPFVMSAVLPDITG
jgi:hypothetical protein